MPTISVIVPVYKVESYINRCVDSILAQTYTDFELILVDDGSPDRCGEICDEYAEKDERVHVIHQENGGLSAARNAGIDWAFANSNSDWLSFIDSDDWVHPQFLETLHDSAVEFQTSISSCAFSKVKGIDDADNSWKECHAYIISSEDEYTQNGRWIYAYVWNKLYKKELWNDVRYPVGRDWEDTVTSYKVIFAVQNIAKTDCELYFYFVNPQGIVYREWTPKKLDHLWAIDEALRNREIAERPEVKRLFLRQRLFTLQEQIQQINESNQISHREKRYFKTRMYREARRLLIWRRKDMGISFKTHREDYENAFPLFFSVYHFGGDVLRRLKIK